MKSKMPRLKRINKDVGFKSRLLRSHGHYCFSIVHLVNVYFTVTFCPFTVALQCWVCEIDKVD